MRASTADCAVLDCVRQALAQIRVPDMPERPRYVGLYFTLRDTVDIHGDVMWDSSADRRECTDRSAGPASADLKPA